MQLIYHDEQIVVCLKSVGVDSEHELPQALQKALGGDIFTLHRLDKNIGGIMIYARTKTAAATFSRLIQDGQMVKEYVAMVHGMPPENGDWQDLLFKDNRKNKVFVVKKQRAGVKPARLEFRRIYTGAESLVHIRLHTGRSHQIRVQFSSRGFPLVGDHKYGSRAEKKEPMLYSCRITVPYKGELKVFENYPDWYTGDP